MDVSLKKIRALWCKLNGTEDTFCRYVYTQKIAKRSPLF